MAEASVNIYVDASFLAAASGYIDVITRYEAGENDSIGIRDIITYVDFSEPEAKADLDYSVYYNTGTSTSGNRDLQTYLMLIDSVVSGTLMSLVDYTVPASGIAPSSSKDIPTNFIRSDGIVQTYKDNRVNYAVDFGKQNQIAKQVYYDTSTKVSGVASTVVNYAAGGYQDPTDPTDQVRNSGTSDLRSYFETATISAGPYGTKDNYVDVTLAWWLYYYYYFETICGLEGAADGPKFESTVISGAIDNIFVELATGVSGTSGYITDLHCGLEDFAFYYLESQVIKGSIGYNYFDIYCGASKQNVVGFDVQLLSLKITNFSIDEGAYEYATGTLCVDVIDDFYNVSTSGTYFIIDGAVVSGTFSPIDDGYRMCYDPADNFASLVGSTEFTVHATNDHGDVLERSFYLTSGYIVDYTNDGDENYGYGRQIVVRMQAENMGSCPVVGTDAYWFVSKDYRIVDLGAYIYGVDIEEESSVDLSARIFPQSTAFFYGESYTIEIKAKDFAGNEMEPFIFTFQIEDKPN